MNKLILLIALVLVGCGKCTECKPTEVKCIDGHVFSKRNNDTFWVQYGARECRADEEVK